MSIRKMGYVIVFLLVILLFIIFLYGGKGATDQASTPDVRDLWRMYRLAVKDAQIASQEEISRNLTAIIESNSNLIWDKHDSDQPRVMVVTWTGDFYNDKVGKSIQADRFVWVTVAPELRYFCTNYQKEYPNLTIRLKQLLGLPPDSVKSRFVEIWVYPYDLFRPSPDPEITDHEAELTFPESKFINVSNEYIKWFNEQEVESYGQDGYPWTRLGYTYDWGNPESEVGLSEFVINQGSIIEVKGSYSLKDYCWHQK
ncbi:MAG: hypothetical protein O8C61_10070 [Candidatus Methanoperedens sp.]|nr:hypothetical protein [Candidatus Methanoperedens sp.]